MAAMAGRLQLRYPTALDLPTHQPGPGDEQAPEGISIDRRVFRRLRRRSRTALEAEAEQAEQAGQACEVWSGTPELQGAYGRGTSSSASVAAFDGNAAYAPRTIADMAKAMLDEVGRPRSDAPLESPMRSWATPHRGAGAAGSLASPWLTPSPMRASSRSDPVSRGAQLRALWSKDRFLRGSSCRKFDLRGCGSPAGKVNLQRGAPLLVPDYVPPHEKRRDVVRMRVRQQMFGPEFA